MLAKLRRDASIVILTGAGISAESGIQTFRGAGGLWEGVRVEDVASPEAFRRNPALVQRFYNERRRALVTDAAIRPNAAHAALARLEQAWEGEYLLVTQNVDDLHERAGSRRLIHMHGELRKVRCEISAQVFDRDDEVTADSRCSCCGRTGTLRPHVVWFGEMPLEMDRIYAALGRARLFLSIGTSGNVYPAAGFVDAARAVGALTAELNLEPSRNADTFTEGRYGPASEVVPALVETLLGG